MAAAIPPIPNFTVRDAMVRCGASDTIIFDGRSVAQRLAGDIFLDDFATCMDKTFDEVNSDLKTYSELTVAQGQIRLLPGIKNNIRAFIQWTRDERRLGRNPARMQFPVGEAAMLMRRYKTHQKFVEQSKTLSEASKPEKFTKETKWLDWKQTFLNYLRNIPGRDGVPLKYVCRDHDQPNPIPHDDFLDDYVAMAQLNGEAFTIDSRTVHTLITNFIAGNDTAEAKIQSNEHLKNGRMDFRSLCDHYEGVGILAIDITKAEATLRNLHYTGE